MLAQPNPLEIALTERSAEEAKAVINQAKAWNRQHGFIAEDNPAPAKTEPSSPSWWSRNVSGPFGSFLTNHFPKPPKSEAAAAPVAGNVGVIYLSLSKAPPAGQEVAVNFGRKPRGIEYIGLGKSDKGFGLKEGERFVFNADNWNQPAMAVIQLDPKLKSDTAVTFVTSCGNIPVAWSITLFFVAGLFLAFSCWHSVMLPRPANDGPVKTHHSLAGRVLRHPGLLLPEAGRGAGDGLHPPLPL